MIMFDIVQNNRKDIKYFVFYIHRVILNVVQNNRTTRSRTENIVFL